MSMRVLSMAQFVEIFFAYSVVTLLIPGLLLKEKLKELSFAERLTGYFLAGNFYCINLVFLLEFLHISCRVTLIFGTALPFLIRGYKKCNEVSFGRERFQKFLLGFKALLSGTYGVKTLLADIAAWISDKIPEVKIKKIWKHIPELILCLAVVAGILYVYGLNNFTEYGYKGLDMPVHNYWINLMDKNQIFKMGVYPHGFHCMIYYLHVVFGIKTYVLLRLFSLVQVLFIHLAIVGCLRMICKARFTPYIAAGLYLMASIFGKNTYSRYASALPQEYGMLFILPVVCFAVRFLDEYAAHLKETDEEKKKIQMVSGRSGDQLFFKPDHSLLRYDDSRVSLPWNCSGLFFPDFQMALSEAGGSGRIRQYSSGSDPDGDRCCNGKSVAGFAWLGTECH